MLVLTRRKSESLVIGDGQDQIRVTILDSKGGQVRIGVDAPKHVKINREEVHERIAKGVPHPNAKTYPDPNPKAA